MKKVVLTLLISLVSLGFVIAQSAAFKPDTIVKLNGKKIAATVFKVDKYSIVFLEKGSKMQIKLPRKDVSHIVYRTGKVQNIMGDVQSTNAIKPANTNTSVKTVKAVKTNTQNTVAASSNKIDSVYKADGKILLVSIAQTTDKIVFYKIPGKKDVFSIDKKDLLKIVYNDGRVEEFTKPAPVMKDIQCDTIIHLSGKRILAQVLKVNVNDISIQKPDEASAGIMQRKDIEKVIYRGGKIEEFNKPVLQMLDDTQWEAVMITENASDVVGLYKRGTILANSASDARDVKAAKKSATIRMQKKAAAMKANIVHVTREEAKGGYGEVPGYEMEGVAYGFEPSGEETIEGTK